MPKKQTEWSRAYNERAYDRISVTCPKGLKPRIDAHAKAKGQTVNRLINSLLMADMGLSESEWTQKEEKPGE